ncbi:MAG TPA: hypothetical protein VGF17_14185, partial [Phytomonospora sp.]
MSSSSSRLAATLALLAAASTSLASPLAAQRPDDRRDIRPSTRPESRAVAAAAGVPAALADSGSAGVAGGSTAEEPAYLELVLPPLQSQTVTVYRRRDLAFVALDDIASLAGVRPAESGARRWRGALGLRGTELDVDVDLHRVTTDGRPLDARADEVLARQGHVYLASSLLARAIGLRAEVDWDVLALRLAGGDSLPAVQRIRRMQAYATVLERRAATASADRVDRALDRTRSLLGGLSVDYSVSMPTGTGRTRQPSFLLTGGSEVLGGALQVQAQGDAGQTRALWSWTDVHTGHAWFQQFRVGNVTTGGPRARPVSGVVVSNAPYIRTSTLGNAPFEGELG